MTELPAEEALKPLRRIILDLAEKKKTVTDLKSKEQQIRYAQELKASDRANLSRKTGTLAPIEGISKISNRRNQHRRKHERRDRRPERRWCRNHAS